MSLNRVSFSILISQPPIHLVKSVRPDFRRLSTDSMHHPTCTLPKGENPDGTPATYTVRLLCGILITIHVPGIRNSSIRIVTIRYSFLYGTQYMYGRGVHPYPITGRSCRTGYGNHTHSACSYALHVYCTGRKFLLPLARILRVRVRAGSAAAARARRAAAAAHPPNDGLGIRASLQCCLRRRRYLQKRDWIARLQSLW